MGKIRGLSKKDVVPSILNVAAPRTHKTFDDNDVSIEAESESPEEAIHSFSNINANNDDTSPEEFTTNDVSIQELKQLHESIIVGKKSSTKKRKAQPEKFNMIRVNSNAPVDLATLDALAEVSETARVIAEKPKKKPSNNKHTIDKDMRKSKQIGHWEVSVIDNLDNNITTFTVSASADKFAKSLQSSHPRMRYNSFVSQKRQGPAKVFKTSSTKR